MANVPMYDPLSSEARSSWIAGLTEACNKISQTLNMKTGTFKGLELSELYISKDDRYRIYQAALGNKLWLSSPAPIIKKNGLVITPSSDNFTIDYLGGSIVFERGHTLTENDTITVDATYIIDESNTIRQILSKIEELELSASNFSGFFNTYDSMVSSLGTGSAGQYAIVGGTENSIYIWNPTTEKWENTFKQTDLSNYYTSPDVDNLLNQKENKISPVSSIPTPADDDYYWGGRKTWQSLPQKVMNASIDSDPTLGISLPIDCGDPLNFALFKLQNQISEQTHEIGGNSDPTELTVGKIGQSYTNRSSGDKFYCTQIIPPKNPGGINTYKWEPYARIGIMDDSILNYCIAAMAVAADNSTRQICQSPFGFSDIYNLIDSFVVEINENTEWENIGDPSSDFLPEYITTFTFPAKSIYLYYNIDALLVHVSPHKDIDQPLSEYYSILNFISEDGILLRRFYLNAAKNAISFEFASLYPESAPIKFNVNVFHTNIYQSE